MANSGSKLDDSSAVIDEKVFTMLENNPVVMNELAHNLGVSGDIGFHDIYSLYDHDILATIPRPVYALLATIPLTNAWKQEREAEDLETERHQNIDDAETAIWFRQDIIHGCGLIGFLHCFSNGPPSKMITPDSDLARFMAEATSLNAHQRARLLAKSETLYQASEAVAPKGDTKPIEDDGPAGNHFVAFVKGSDGNLWELEGSRKGPINRGHLHNNEDAMSDNALNMGIRRLIELQRDSNANLRFSCIALGPKSGETND